MSQIRKAHTVEIIDRRLRACEVSGALDPMELIGLHDELSRVERKWREKAADAHQPPNPARRRPLANAAHMNARFDRLTRLVDAALRRPLPTGGAERALLESISTQLRARQPLPVDQYS